MSMSERTIRERAGRADVERPDGGADYAAGVNVGDGERLASVAGGALLALWGLRRGRPGGLALAALGGILIYRGASGHCPAYGALGIDRSDGGPRVGNLGVRIDRRVTVQAPPERLFAAWRDLTNLPRFLSHVESVQVIGPSRSRWRVQGPAGFTTEWDAEIINEVPDRLIAWRTVANLLVDHAGSVRFEPAGDGRTDVAVSLQYDPLGGEAAHALASMLGEDPGRRIEEDLQAFRRAMESRV
jgi:uncharacterized membrane protein